MYEIGSEFNLIEHYDRKNLISFFTDKAEKSGKYIEFLRCGRDAIGFVADDIIADDLSDERKTVFMPALSCDSMVRPFEVRGFNVVYYKLNDNLTVHTDSLINAIGDVKAPVVLLMNFYGITEANGTIEAIRDKYSDAILIEDVTHILFNPEKYLDNAFYGKDEYVPDYQVGSIRKWLGVPDGAFVISKKEFIMGALTGETDFTDMRYEALKEKTEYLENGDPELKDHFRKLLSDAEDTLSDGLDPYHISDLSADILSDVDAGTLEAMRNVNYKILYKKLEKLPLCGKAFRLLKETELSEYGIDYEYTPFMLPIVLDIDFMRRSAITEEGKNITRDGFENRLAARGIYAPVLWPISDEAAKVCEVSAEFSNNMLAFWIDQRYDRFDMEQAADIFDEELSRL